MLRIGLIGLLALGVTACGAAKPPAKIEVIDKAAVAQVYGPDAIAVGRYIVLTGGCNDCHTPGYAPSVGKSPSEDKWLTGNPVGYRGPWGVTYASNLRLTVSNMTKDQFIAMLGAREGAPPMPWPSVKAMTPANRGAVYDYIKSLGPGGEATPANVPPGQEPTTPYENMMPFGPDGKPLAHP